MNSLAVVLVVLASLALNPVETDAQEKKNVRVVFVSHTWTSSLPFRIAMARGYFNIPQAVIATRSEILEKDPETTKRFLKAHIMGLQLARNNKSAAIKGF